jgi:glycosyltransferase involved in cell wall biosynthesis
VASAVGGIPELVEDGVTGLLVEPGDVEGLRSALERLLADPELRGRMGRAGRARIVEGCSIESVTEATLDAYRQDELLALPAGRAQTITPSLQKGTSRPALP